MQRQVARAGCNIARHNRPPPRLKGRPSRAEVAKTRRIWLTMSAWVEPVMRTSGGAGQRP
jgi:hypothetical protein